MSLISGQQTRSMRSGGFASQTMGQGGATYQERKGKALAAKNTVVMGYDELERIKSMCKQTNDMEDYRTMRESERLNLQNLSKARISKWPNTIQAQREKKEYERIKKLEDDEIERRRVDAEEEAYQQELRQKQLDKANKQFYDNSDMVKALHSKMLMCDVATEQAEQKEYKKRRAQLEKDIDAQWEEIEKQKQIEYDERLRARLEKEYTKKLVNAKEVQDQLTEFQQNFIKNMKNDEMEGQLIKKQVEEELEKEKLRDLERKKKALKQMEEFKKANNELLDIQAQIALKEKEEERRIEEHSKKKEALEHLRKVKVAEKFAQKQAIKQKLIDRQIGDLMKVRDQQEEILNKQVAEAEDKANQLFEEKERRRNELKNAMQISRKNQIIRKEKEVEEAKMEENELAHFWRMRNEELNVAEQQEKEEERQRRVELTNYHKHQIDQKRIKAESEFVAEQHTAFKNIALQDQQEKNFYSYAEKCIAEWEAQGKNIKPLVMELKNYKKRVV